MEKQYHRHNIRTPFDLYNQPITNLSKWFGHPGRVWYHRLRGFETDDHESPTKSIGHQHVLAPKYRNRAAARQVLSKMAQKCAHRLRGKNLYAGGVSVWVNFWNAPSVSKNISTGFVSDGQTILKLVLKIYDQFKMTNRPFRLGVTLFNLTQNKNRQISLLPEVEKSIQVSLAMDKINDEFGDETIMPASMFGSLDSAPNRIPFGDPGRLEF
jgi:DNA polymerase-4